MDNKKKSKILMLGNTPTAGRYRGGITYIVEEIIKEKKYLNDNGYDIELFNTEMIIRKCDTENKWDFKNILNAILLIKKVREKIKVCKYEYIYIHGSVGLGLFKNCVLIKNIRKIFNGQIILHVHYAEIEKIMPKNKLLSKYILNVIYKYIDKVIFLSKETRDEFVNNGIEREKTYVLYNFQQMNIEKEYIIKKIDNCIGKDKVNLLFVGSIDRRKGIIDLIRSLETIKSGEFVLNICGSINDQDIKKEFEALIDRNKENIKFYGYLSGDDKKNIFKDSDILVLPSYGEGLPVVILEGMAAGCAIVTTDVGAIPEVIESGQQGILIKPGKINELGKAIDDVIKDREYLKILMKNSYYSSSKYEMKQFLDKFMKICRD